MQIYETLKKDHDEVREMLTQLIGLGAEAPAEVRNGLIAEIRDALVPHSRAEEAVFYNSLRAVEKAAGLVMHGYQEHLEAEGLLRALQVTGKIDAGWLATAEKLKAALEHHIAEEEGKIFTAARQVFTTEEAEMMGEAFEKLKPEIKGEGMMATTMELVANVMPPRFSKAFSKFNLESRI
jgi:hemerythrin-like domain-containing protein